MPEQSSHFRSLHIVCRFKKGAIVTMTKLRIILDARSTLGNLCAAIYRVLLFYGSLPSQDSIMKVNHPSSHNLSTAFFIHFPGVFWQWPYKECASNCRVLFVLNCFWFVSHCLQACAEFCDGSTYFGTQSRDQVSQRYVSAFIVSASQLSVSWVSKIFLHARKFAGNAQQNASRGFTISIS